MDWPVVGAISGVAGLAAILGIGAYALTSSPTVPTARAATSPMLLVERARFAPNPPSALPEPPMSLSAAPAPAETPGGVRISGGEPPRLTRRFEPAAKAKPERLAKIDAAQPIEAAPREEKVNPREEREERAKAPEPKAAAVAKLAPPPEEKPAPDPRLAKVLTPTKIAQVRATLRLQPDQAQHWPLVAASLNEIGRDQVEQIKRGKDPEVGMGAMWRLYGAAGPLLAALNPEQKERVRALARSLGYANLASRL